MITSRKAPGYFVPVDESGNIGLPQRGNGVSISETYWSRLLAYGRNAYFMGFNRPLSATGVITDFSHYASKGNVFTPHLMTGFCTVDAELHVAYQPMGGFDPYSESYGYEYYVITRVKAKEPWPLITFDGSLKITSPGHIRLRITADADEGTASYCIQGIEGVKQYV